jgi:hypothetical protein
MAARLLEFPPVYCSACWCSFPDKRHVDYSCDNDQGYGDDPNNKVPYDNLQLCEDCMKHGAQLVGMVDGSEREALVHDQELTIDRLKRELRQSQTFADNLESAFEHRPEHGPIRIDHRKKPREIHPKETV